jgi:thiol-disulfide isomerase/thioredoxin
MKGLNVLILSGLLITAAVPRALAMGDAGFIQESLKGTSAVGFVLPTVKGKNYDFKSSTAGKKAVVVFWATWCPHCRVALKEINAVASQIAANHVEVVLINVGEDKESVANYLNRNKYEFDVVLDENGSVSQEYQVSGIPKVLFVDEQGTIKSVGYDFPKNYMDEFK